MTRIKLTEQREVRYWHTMSRGNNGQVIFQRDSDYEEFLHRLVLVVQGSGIKLTALALMPNHYHLVVPGTGPDLIGFLRRLKAPYSRAFNSAWVRTGHLFQPRHNSIPYNLALARYITAYVHLNPRTAGFHEEDPRSKWTSLPHYLDPSNAPFWLDPTPILAMGDYRGFLAAVDRQSVGPAPDHECRLATQVRRRINEVFRLFDRFLFDHSPEIAWREKKARQLTLLTVAERTGASVCEIAKALGYSYAAARKAKRNLRDANALLRSSPWLHATLTQLFNQSKAGADLLKVSR